MMDSAPGIPTKYSQGLFENEYDDSISTTDPYTSALNESLNAMTVQVPTQQFYQRARILQYSDVGLDDANYNVGYHHVNVPQEVKVERHFEAPEVPVTQLPFMQAIYNTTLVQELQSSMPLYSLRAPAINEGS